MTFETISRRGILGVFAATTMAAAPVMANAFGLIRGAGDIRRIRMYSGRTGESIDTVYWVEGKYIRDALNEINVFMRDWRTGQVIGIDPRTVDIAAASHRLLQTNEPYMMLSGYRSPKTNAMLRSRSSGVARVSYDGKTVDYRSVAEIDRAIEALDREIAAAEGRRIVRQVRVTTTKGL